MIRALLLSAAISLAAASAARAADDASASDVRCLAVASVLASNTNPAVKNAGVMAALYYLGKLDGREPAMDLEARLKQVIAEIKPEEIQPEAQRCGAELAVRGKAVTDIGARLQALTKDKAP